MRSITFTASEADALAAQRSIMRQYVFSWRRMLTGYLPIWWLTSGVICGVLLGVVSVLDIAVNSKQTIAIAIVGMVCSLMLLALFIFLTFAGLPRLVKREYAQQAMLRVEYTVRWSSEGVEITTPRGSTSHLWSDFIKWAEGRETVMLFQSDRVCNFIPVSACSVTDLNDLRAKLAAAGVKRA